MLGCSRSRSLPGLDLNGRSGMAIGIGLTGLIIGLVVGLWLFRLRSRWCPRCGEWTLARPFNEEHARLVREVVAANDPLRNTPAAPARVSAAEPRRMAGDR